MLFLSRRARYSRSPSPFLLLRRVFFLCLTRHRFAAQQPNLPSYLPPARKPAEESAPRKLENFLGKSFIFPIHKISSDRRCINKRRGPGKETKKEKKYRVGVARSSLLLRNFSLSLIRFWLI